MQYRLRITHEVIDDPTDDEHRRTLVDTETDYELIGFVDQHMFGDNRGDFNTGCLYTDADPSGVDCGEHISSFDEGDHGYFQYSDSHPDPTNEEGWSSWTVEFTPVPS